MGELTLAINVEIALAPCIKAIYNEFYRVVLDEIVSEWGEKGVGLSQYDLYQKPNIHSKGRLNRAIKDLSACGYVVCVPREAKTRSPMGRKECYPTPLGILVHLLASLLGYKIADVATFLAMYIAYSKLEELILQCLPSIYRYLDYADMAHRGSLYSNLDRGYAAVIHALSVLRARVLSPLRTPAALSRLPDSYVELFARESRFIKRRLERRLEEIIDNLRRSLEHLDTSIREWKRIEELLNEMKETFNYIRDLMGKPPLEPEGDHTSSLLYESKLRDLEEQIAKAFELMLKTLEVHEKLQDKTQVSSPVN
jgi:exonuclease VII small subunit